MTILSDSEIWSALVRHRDDIGPGKIFIDQDLQDVRQQLLQPASLDLRLGDSFLEPLFHDSDDLVSMRLRSMEFNRRPLVDGAIIMEPGEFLLATTKEAIGLGPDLVGQLMGKSSVGRMGLTVHVTAGFCDPGFVGNITLEMVNHLPCRLELEPGIAIAQISFCRTGLPARSPYGTRGKAGGSRYQDQMGATAPRR